MEQPECPAATGGGGNRVCPLWVAVRQCVLKVNKLIQRPGNILTRKQPVHSPKSLDRIFLAVMITTLYWTWSKWPSEENG